MLSERSKQQQVDAQCRAQAHRRAVCAPGLSTVIGSGVTWAQAHSHEAQAAVGVFLLLLPTLVKGPLWFPQCCLTPIWFLVGKLLLMREPTVGSHLRLAVQLWFGLSMGILWAAALVSLVKAITPSGTDAELAVLCVIGALGALVVTAGRSAASDAVWINSLLFTVMYGTTILLAHKDPTVGDVWSETIRWLLLTVVLAAAALVVVGCLVLPSTGAEEVAQGASKVLAGTAKALDRCMALLCIPAAQEEELLAKQQVQQPVTATSPGSPAPTTSHAALQQHSQQLRAPEQVQASEPPPVDPQAAAHILAVHNQAAVQAEANIDPTAGHDSTGVGLGGEGTLGHPGLRGWAEGVRSFRQHGSAASLTELSELDSFVLHDEFDTPEDYRAVLFKATQPPPKTVDLALFQLLPHATGDHLMPEGQALPLRRARDAVQKLLVAASSEPPWAHALVAGWRQLLRRLSGRAAVGPRFGESGHWWTMRFHVGSWQRVLGTLGALLDSLAALEAVARDLKDLAPSHTDRHLTHIAHHHHHHHHHHIAANHHMQRAHSHSHAHTAAAHHHPGLRSPRSTHQHAHGPSRLHLHTHGTAGHMTHPHSPHQHGLKLADNATPAPAPTLHSPHNSTSTQTTLLTGSQMASQAQHPDRYHWEAESLPQAAQHARQPGPLAEAAESAADSPQPSSPVHGIRLRNLSARWRHFRTKSHSAPEPQLPTVWHLWLLAEGAQPAGTAPRARKPHHLHHAVRAALRDSAAQVQALSGIAGAWPLPGGNTLPHSSLSTAATKDPSHKGTSPQKAVPRPSQDGVVSRTASLTTQKLRAAVQHLRRSFEGLSGPAAGPEGAGGRVEADPLKLHLDDPLTYEQQHTIEWHRKALAAAMLQRTRAYWNATLKSLWQAEDQHKPLRLLRGDKLRAQYFISLATHQAVCQLEQLITDLQAAYHPAPTKTGTSHTPASGVFTPTAPAGDPSYAWLLQLLPLMSGVDSFKYLAAAAQDTWRAVRGGRAGVRQAFLSERVRAVLKYWAVLTVMLVVVLTLVTKLPADTFTTMPIFAYITTSTVMRPQVESTSSQAVLRVTSTALGCLLGWGLLSSPHSATQPVLIGAVVVIAVTLLTSITRTQFKLMAYVTSTTITSVTACQISGAGCCHNGFTGSGRYALERFITVSVGVLAPVLVNHLIYPWYLSFWALGRLADSYQAANTLLSAQYEALVAAHQRPGRQAAALDPAHTAVTTTLPVQGAPVQDTTDSYQQENKLSGTAVLSGSSARTGSILQAASAPTSSMPALHGSAAGPVTAVTATTPVQAQQGEVVIVVQDDLSAGGADHVAVTTTITSQQPPRQPAPPPPTLASVQGPLTEVVGTLARDAALWQRGLLATPHAVHALMAAMTLMSDRLAALQVVLQGASSFSPAFSQFSSENLATPLDPEVRKVFAAIVDLSSLSCQLLHNWKDPTQRKRLARLLRDQIQVVVALRFHAHHWHVRLRQALHVKVLGMALTTQAPHRSLPGMDHTIVHGTVHSVFKEPQNGTPEGVPSGLGAGTASGALAHGPGLDSPFQAAAANAQPGAAREASASGDDQEGEEQHRAAGADMAWHVMLAAGLDGHAATLQQMPATGTAATQSASATHQGSAAGVHTPESIPPATDPLHPLHGQPTGALSIQTDHTAAERSQQGGLCGGSELDGVHSRTDVVGVTVVSDEDDSTPLAVKLVEQGRSLSALLADGDFHPSDTVTWLACVYALTHALDAAIHVARVAVVVSKVVSANDEA